MTTRRCQSCGEQFSADERFCDNCGATLPAPAPAKPKAAMIGEVIAGRYKIIEEAGKGGMGTVYLAHDLMLNREVAFKLLHASLANRKSAPKRLLREARAAGRINHPNVIQIFDAGKLESDDRPYLVMEFLRGRTLKDILEERSGLPWPELYPLLRQILSGLAAAHAKEVIHRDLKPGNIFVEEDPAGLRIKLVDFGLSKILSNSGGPGMTRLTEDGAVLGTPLYMAPEQVRGDPASSLSDLFAVGVILYRGLTGAFPFTGANAVELYRNILRGNPTPPRLRAPNRDINEAVDALTLRALSAEPSGRPQSAEEFLRLLDQCAQGVSAQQLVSTSLERRGAVVYDSNDESDSQEETGSSEGPKTIQEMASPFSLAPSASLPAVKPVASDAIPTTFWEPQSAPSHPSSIPSQPTPRAPEQVSAKALVPGQMSAVPRAPQPERPAPPPLAPEPTRKTPLPDSSLRRVRELPLVVPMKPHSASPPSPAPPPKRLEKTPQPSISVRRAIEMDVLTDKDKEKK